MAIEDLHRVGEASENQITILGDFIHIHKLMAARKIMVILIFLSI